MKNGLGLVIIAMVVTACGGGGGGSAGSPSAPMTPNTPAVPTLNAAESFKLLVTTALTTADIPAVAPTVGYARLIIGPEEAYPFVTNGVSTVVASSNKIQFQRLSAAGILLRQNLWKFDFDVERNPVGMASGVEFAKYTECMSVTSRTALPTSASSSGVFFSGYQTTAYAETFRSGTYAHYCDPSAAYPANVEWAAVTDASAQYFCLTTPSSFTAAKTQICVPAGVATTPAAAFWIRTYDTNGALLSEYRRK